VQESRARVAFHIVDLLVWVAEGLSAVLIVIRIGQLFLQISDSLGGNILLDLDL
jgi:hypothetical protein